MTPLQDELAGPVKNAAWMLMAGVALILLIACTNVANLLLARTADRFTELSIRSALGASRARLVQQLLTESVLLSLVAFVVGLLVAQWTVSAVAKFQPAPGAAQSYSILDGRVLSFAIAISVLSGLLFGVLPSFYAGRTHAFGSRGSGATRSSRIVQEGLIAAQVMLTIILLASSISIGRAFLSLLNVNHGFDTRGLVTLRVALDGTTYERGDRRLQYFEEAVTRVRELPGVRDVTATEFLPLLATAFLGAPYTMDGRQAKEFSDGGPGFTGLFQNHGWANSLRPGIHRCGSAFRCSGRYGQRAICQRIWRPGQRPRSRAQAGESFPKENCRCRQGDGLYGRRQPKSDLFSGPFARSVFRHHRRPG